VPPRDRLQEVLAGLARIRRDPSSPASVAELRRVLAHESAHAVARAAAIAGEAGLDALVPDLAAAFRRLLSAPAKKDPGCTAKHATVEALLRLEREDEDVFRAGIRHVQMEPVFGGQVDTAVDLRGACALGLARTSRADVLDLLATLLADPEPPARVSAARAIAAHGRVSATPLLRHKALAGDEEPRVVSECLLTLLHLDPLASLPFVASLLEPATSRGRPAPDRAFCAAEALGESRLKEAFPLLRDWYPRAAARRLGRAALSAIAALRRDEAFDYLLSLVREAEPPDACEAALALARQGDEALHARARAAAAGRPAVAAVLERALQGP
jgi:hypothetical protein